MFQSIKEKIKNVWAQYKTSKKHGLFLLYLS